MYLGIDHQTGLIYEGSGNPDLPAIPLPSVTQAKLIEKPSDWAQLPSGLTSSPFSWVFREDSFDPVTRTRRGRLYQAWGNTQARQVRVAPHPYDVPWGPSEVRRLDKSLHVYSTCSELLNKPERGRGMTIALGSSGAISAWRIVDVEALASGALMVTLRALSSYGILPGLDLAKVDEAFLPALSLALKHTLDAAFRESPASVVDRCREALVAVLSRWLAQNGEKPEVLGMDLAKLATAIERAPHEKTAVANLAKNVAIMHARSKSAEQAKRPVRRATEEDAELALHAVGFVLRDLGWAQAERAPGL